MAKPVTIGITKVPETGEYRVFWKEGNKDDENKAYYTDDALDAVNTLCAIYEKAQKEGTAISITRAAHTCGLLRRYGWSSGHRETTNAVLSSIGTPGSHYHPLAGGSISNEHPIAKHHSGKRIEGKINKSTPDSVCLTCSQLYEGECRAYEMPHSKAEQESRLRDGGKLACRRSIVIKDRESGRVIKEIPNLTDAEQTHLANQVLDPNPETEVVDFN